MKKVNKTEVMRIAHVFWKRHKDNIVGLKFGYFLKRSWLIEKTKAALEWDNYNDVPQGTAFCTYYNKGRVVFTVTSMAEVLIPAKENDIQSLEDNCQALTGTEKQVSYAEDIRRSVLLTLATALENAKRQAAPGNVIARMHDKINYVQSLTKASEIIFRYKNYFYTWSESNIFAEPQRAYRNLCHILDEEYESWKTKQ